ncbi:hypothetical protein CLOM_g16698 [Closterium sp. NIES-68]|nr:hypothetical protein CLOM_g16698 [Closterium sp. NIES-68]GJP82819.1 hypothetical protein CLOP_g13047 [Closterium sp. NIES-67]
MAGMSSSRTLPMLRLAFVLAVALSLLSRVSALRRFLQTGGNGTVTVTTTTTTSTSVSNSTTYGPDGSVISTGSTTAAGSGGTGTGGSTASGGGTGGGGSSSSGGSTGSGGGTSSGGSSSTVNLNAPTRYSAVSRLNNGEGYDLTAKFTVDANITAAKQNVLFQFLLMKVPTSPPPVLSKPAYYTSSGALITDLACTFTPQADPTTLSCGLGSEVALSLPFKAGGKVKSLIDAGFFASPSSAYSSITVNGIELRGQIVPTVTNL